MLSPGIETKEYDFSTIIRESGNSVTAFVGEFEKGRSSHPTLINSTEDLINVYGEPTNKNYNDWFQAYTYLQYADKLYINRAIDANGAWYTTDKQVLTAKEKSILTNNDLTKIKIGSILKFGENAEDEYTVSEVISSKDATPQIDIITITEDLATNDEIKIMFNGNLNNTVLFRATENTTAVEVATSVMNLINTSEEAIEATAEGSIITLKSHYDGTSFITEIVSGKATTETIQVAESESNALGVKQIDILTLNSDLKKDDKITIVINGGDKISYVAEDDITKNDVAIILGDLLKENSTFSNVKVSNNVIELTASAEGVIMNIAVEDGDVKHKIKTKAVLPIQAEIIFYDELGTLDLTSTAIGIGIFLKDKANNAHVNIPFEGEDIVPSSTYGSETLLIENDDDFDSKILPINEETSIKFYSKDSGSYGNDIQIAIAKEDDFKSNQSYVFNGILLNSLVATKPLESKKELVIFVKKDDEIETFLVSTLEDAKDYRNKTMFIEEIINVGSRFVYCKLGATLKRPSSLLYKRVDSDGVVSLDKQPVVLQWGSDGEISASDIALAHGSVSDGSIFGDKARYEIDMIIANERSRVSGAELASSRKDCICFIGSKYEDTVGQESYKIVENLLKDVNEGELGNITDSYSALFGNYILINDKLNDKKRWVNVAGSVAGLKAKTNKERDVFYASAGLNRGILKGVLRIAFNPTNGQRDVLYESNVNPIISMLGKGNAIVFGQKNLQRFNSSMDRVNVRSLFNSIERSVEKMALYSLFEINDAYTRNQFIGAVKPMLDAYKATRGIENYKIVCDETNNTDLVRNRNEFVASILIQPTKSVEFIKLNFAIIASGVSFDSIYL